MKTMLKFLWHPPMATFSIPGIIWRGTACFVQNSTTITLSGDELNNSSSNNNNNDNNNNNNKVYVHCKGY